MYSQRKAAELFQARQTKLEPFTSLQAQVPKRQPICFHGACCPLVAFTLTCKRKRHLLPKQWREGNTGKTGLRKPQEASPPYPL